MGVIVARLTGGTDPRTVGSGRTGGTNALRAMGPARALTVGLLDIASFKAGEVVFVSGAAGAVGSMAGQIAKLKGAARVIGSAGTDDKVRWLREILAGVLANHVRRYFGTQARDVRTAYNVLSVFLSIAAIVAVIVMVSVSRLRTWASSWASTPAISSRESIRNNPVVAATAACSGLRPVAKALGCGLSIR